MYIIIINISYNHSAAHGTQFSCIPRTIREWRNELPAEATAADTLDTFVWFRGLQKKRQLFDCLFVLLACLFRSRLPPNPPPQPPSLYKRRKCSFHLPVSFGCSIKTYTKEVPFVFASHLSTQGAAMLVDSLPIKTWKGSARDVIDTFAIHAGLAYDVTGILLMGKTWQHSRSCLNDFTNVNF